MNENMIQKFCGKFIGGSYPPFIVAEIGFNHLGDVVLAREMIRSAAENSADAVKLQTFVAEKLLSTTHMEKDPQNPGKEIPIYEFFRRYQLQRREYEDLFEYSAELDIPLFSTPFDETSLDMIVDLGAPAIKVASPDLTHIPLLRRVARKGLPVVLSTGMATEEEIEMALNTLRENGSDDIVLLHCVSSYPASYEEMNLLCLRRLSVNFKVPVGLSDHTVDDLSAVTATALGAVMIEKHFTIDRKLSGADNAISMEPDELKKLKTATVNVKKAMGDGIKKVQPSEEGVRKAARRSLVARMDIEPGTVLAPEMLEAKRPGTGISPKDLDRVIGKKARTRIVSEQIITWDMVCP